MRHLEDEGGEGSPDQLGRDRTEGVERQSADDPEVFTRTALRPGQESGKNLRN